MKYCSQCGKDNEDHAAFCVQCGTNMGASPQETPAGEQPTAEPPVVEVQPTATYTAPVESYTPPSNTYSAATPVNGGQQATDKNPATLWLILNIVATLCCGGWLNIVGIIFAALGMSSYNKGDMADGDSKTKVAKIIFWIGLALGLLTIIIVAVTVGAAITNEMSYYW